MQKLVSIVKFPWAICLLFVSAFWACDTPTPQTKTAPEVKDSTAFSPSKRSSALDAAESRSQGDIYIAVDETFRPVVNTMVQVYETTYPKAKIHVRYMPGEQAINAMVNNDSIRVAICTRLLGRKEEKALRSQGTSPKVIPLGEDAIGLITHPSNPIKKLTAEQLRGILTGSITRWNALDAQGPDQPITVVFDNGQSSTVQFLQNDFLEGGQVKGYQQGSNPAVIDYIADEANRYSLGVIGIAWISDSDSQQAQGFLDKINLLGLESLPDCPYNGKYGNFLQPYQGPIKAACYRLTRKVYAIHRETRNGLGTGFCWWMASPETGQRLILKSGLVPDRSVTRAVLFPERIP